jgi:hypothetical protein
MRVARAAGGGGGGAGFGSVAGHAWETLGGGGGRLGEQGDRGAEIGRTGPGRMTIGDIGSISPTQLGDGNTGLAHL